MKTPRSIFGVVGAAFLLAACSNMQYAASPGGYIVRPGDTLYTIAWRHGVDHRDLAAWNGLTNPDLIYVGQRLVVAPPRGAAARPSAPARAPTRATPRPRPDDPAPVWQWPTRGPVVSAFGDGSALSSGIGIGGRRGQQISAAAAGRVVYAGSGLVGYGQLVIIKHNETFLSAYGHNSRLLVRQGDEVRRGQPIAEMGLGPDREPRLHFEIRRNGTPVDPMRFLRSAG